MALISINHALEKSFRIPVLANSREATRSRERKGCDQAEEFC